MEKFFIQMKLLSEDQVRDFANCNVGALNEDSSLFAVLNNEDQPVFITQISNLDWIRLEEMTNIPTAH